MAKIKKVNSLQELINQRGGWKQIAKYLTTSLTPLWVNKIQAKTMQDFNKKKGNRPSASFVIPKGYNGNIFLLTLEKERATKVIKEITNYVGDVTKSNILEPWENTVKNIKSDVKKMVYESGIIIYKIKDGTSRFLTDNRLVRKKAVEYKRNENKKTPTISPQTKMFKRRLLDNNSLERGLLDSYLNPKKYGRISDEYYFGWSGFVSSIQKIPLPDKYSSHIRDMLMGYTITGNNKGYIGVSIGEAAKSMNETLEMMLNKAMELDLNIPKRPDGKEWKYGQKILMINEEDEKKERDIYKRCLMELKTSPFVGDKKLTQGTSILIRDETIIDLAATSGELTPLKIGRNIAEYKKEKINRLKTISPKSKEQKIDIKEKIEHLSSLKESYSGYIEDLQKLNEYELLEHERNLISQKIGIQTVESKDIPDWGVEFGGMSYDSNGIDFTPYASHAVLPENKESIKLSNEVKFLEARSFGFKLTPENTDVIVNEELGSISLKININNKDREETGLEKLQKITNENSIPLYHLSNGDYNVKSNNKNITVHIDSDAVGNKTLVLDGTTITFPRVNGINIINKEELKQEKLQEEELQEELENKNYPQKKSMPTLEKSMQM